MDIFEKQQTIEAIKTAVKARWFFAFIISFQGVIVKLLFPRVPLATAPALSLILLSAFVFNLGYWAYLRRPPERMSDWGLQMVKAMQILMDMIWISAILYFSGTVGKMAILLYFVVIMVGASLYQKKGVVFSTLLAQFLFTVLVILQYEGLMKSEPSIKEVFGVEFNVGDKQTLIFILVGFYSYSLATAVFAGYLARLFREREERLQVQKNELTEKTELLTLQTQELTLAKGLLQDALIKSDTARVEAGRAKEELEKANLELRKKIEELEKFYRVTVGREIKMMELKKEIKTLREQIKNRKRN